MVRFKQRYLLVRVAREGQCKGVNLGDVLNALRRSMERQLGAWCVGVLLLLCCCVVVCVVVVLWVLLYVVLLHLLSLMVIQ